MLVSISVVITQDALLLLLFVVRAGELTASAGIRTLLLKYYYENERKSVLG